MAARLGLSGHDQLQHFIASPAWNDAPLWTALAQQADRLVGRADAYLVIDDAALPKQGALSVGVARQYCGELGKRANCQALVSLTLAQARCPCRSPCACFCPRRGPGMRPVAPGQASLMQRWHRKTRVRSLWRSWTGWLRLACASAPCWPTRATAPVPCSATGWTRAGWCGRSASHATRRSTARTCSSCRPRAVPGALCPARSREAEAVLSALPWRRVTWRHGTKGPLAARFAATRVRVGDGPARGNNRHLPGKEAWLVGEWRASGERKFYLSNLPSRTALRTLAAAIKARWVCEQAHQQLKQELGLGHFEGRSWTGLHRHALMTCIACAYLQHLRLAGPRRTGPGKNASPRSGAATIAKPARRATHHHGVAVRAPDHACPLPTLQAQIPATA